MTTCAMPTSATGRAKKSLAHQLDRLDTILDGLAEALNGAVADAVKDAVGAAVAEAVKATLAEVLNHPDLVARLAPTAPTPAPTWRERLTAAARRVRAATKTAAGWVSRTISRTVVTVAAARAAFLARPTRWFGSARACLSGIIGLVGALRRGLVTALLVGVAVGAGCYLAGPVVASSMSGLGGAAVALAAAVARPAWPLIRLAVAGPAADR